MRMAAANQSRATSGLDALARGIKSSPVITAGQGTNRDHTLCTILNDLHANERQEPSVNHKNHQLPGKMGYR